MCFKAQKLDFEHFHGDSERPLTGLAAAGRLLDFLGFFFGLAYSGWWGSTKLC